MLKKTPSETIFAKIYIHLAQKMLGKAT